MRLFFLVCLLFVSGAALFAQTLTLTSAPARVGAPVAITVTLSGASQAGIAAAQWFVPTQPGIAIAPGPAITAAAKNLVCQTANGIFGCVAAGMPSSGGFTALSDGVLATITFPMPPNGAPMPLTNMLGANAAGDAPGIAISSGPLLTLAPISPCDVNSDGRTDILDIRNVIDQIQGVISPATADLNGDGKVDVIDLQRVVNAAQQGGTCRTGA